MDQRRTTGRSRRPPSRLDFGGDDLALQKALKRSVQETQRVVHKVPECPVFRPTTEELGDFLGYIASIADVGAAAGLVKIIPPDDWRPRSSDITVPGHFGTKRQHIHRLQEGVAFAEGKVYTHEEYRREADAARATWLAQHPDIAALDDPEEAAQAIEDAYWRIVERVSPEEVTVDYGNDLDTKKYGSGFAGAAWDLHRLQGGRGSALRLLEAAVEGVTYPWLYLGALFTTFCWHNEDHYLASLNYHHAGAPKTWYGIPAASARRFEEALVEHAPERFQEDRDLLYQLVTVVPPSLLLQKGVAVVHGVQRAGEMMVTFPKAYHCGFSHGWNCGEAVNFARLEWLPFGQEAVAKYARGGGKRPPIFCHDRLVWEWCKEAIRLAEGRSGTGSGELGTSGTADAHYIQRGMMATGVRAPSAHPSSRLDRPAEVAAPAPAPAPPPPATVKAQPRAVAGSLVYAPPGTQIDIHALHRKKVAAREILESGRKRARANGKTSGAVSTQGDAPAAAGGDDGEKRGMTEAGPPQEKVAEQEGEAAAQAKQQVEAASQAGGSKIDGAAVEVSGGAEDGGAEARQDEKDGGMASTSGRLQGPRPDNALEPAQLRLLYGQLQDLARGEFRLRGALRRVGIGCEALPARASWQDHPGCAECLRIPYLAHVICMCSEDELRCLEHAHIGCTCPWAHKRLRVQVPDEQLQAMLARLAALLQESESGAELLKADESQPALQSKRKAAAKKGSILAKRPNISENRPPVPSGNGAETPPTNLEGGTPCELVG